MTLAGDSILVTPGSGATVATHTVGSKEHQVIMLADVSGNIWGSEPIYEALAAGDVKGWPDDEDLLLLAA